MRLVDRLFKHETPHKEPVVVVPRQARPEPVDTSPTEAEAWARAAVEARDWAALVAVMRSTDYSREFNKDYRKLLARKALRAAGTDAVDAVIGELRAPGVGTDDVATVLAEIGDERAVDPLLAVFEDVAAYGGAQSAIVELLARVGAKRAATTLMGYLDNGYELTRINTAYGLGLLAVERTRPALKQALAKGDDAVRRGLQRADTDFARSLAPKPTGSYRTYVVVGDETRGPAAEGTTRIGSAGFATGYAAGWLDWSESRNHDCVRDLGHSHLSREDAEACLSELTATWRSQGIDVDRE
jgi:hypothetical protein